MSDLGECEQMGHCMYETEECIYSYKAKNCPHNPLNEMSTSMNVTSIRCPHCNKKINIVNLMKEAK